MSAQRAVVSSALLFGGALHRGVASLAAIDQGQAQPAAGSAVAGDAALRGALRELSRRRRRRARTVTRSRRAPCRCSRSSPRSNRAASWRCRARSSAADRSRRSRRFSPEPPAGASGGSIARHLRERQRAAARSRVDAAVERLGQRHRQYALSEAKAAGLTGADVPKLTLKWAFGFAGTTSSPASRRSPAAASSSATTTATSTRSI